MRLLRSIGGTGSTPRNGNRCCLLGRATCSAGCRLPRHTVHASVDPAKHLQRRGSGGGATPSAAGSGSSSGGGSRSHCLCPSYHKRLGSQWRPAASALQRPGRGPMGLRLLRRQRRGREAAAQPEAQRGGSTRGAQPRRAAPRGRAEGGCGARGAQPRGAEQGRRRPRQRVHVRCARRGGGGRQVVVRASSGEGLGDDDARGRQRRLRRPRLGSGRRAHGSTTGGAICSELGGSGGSYSRDSTCCVTGDRGALRGWGLCSRPRPVSCSNSNSSGGGRGRRCCAGG